MKRRFNVVVATVVLSSSILFSSCIGSFSLFNKLLAWNQSINDKWINELVFIVISPAYVVAMMADSIVLNSIEFWTGENPVTDVKVQKIEGKNGFYTIETDKEGHKITKEETGETVYFHFNGAEKTWSIEANGVETPLMKVVDEQHAVMYLPNGSEMPVTLDKAGVLALQQAVMDNVYFTAL